MPYADKTMNDAAKRDYYSRNRELVKLKNVATRLIGPRVESPQVREAARVRARKWYSENVAAVRSRNNLPKPTRPEPDICECCGRLSGKRRLHLDHDHATGLFRGWLCGSCNTGIGALGDTAESVQRALHYIQINT